MSKRILIVGGVAGGASAAARARRLDEHAEIIMFERGQNVSFSNCCLPFHLCGTIPRSDDLVLMTPDVFWDRYRIQAKVRHEVTSINREKKTIEVKNLDTDETFEEEYDVLILSPGASPILPRSIEGIDSDNVYTVRNVQDIEKLKMAADNAQEIVVIGGGFIGMEVMESLIHAGKSVHLVEMLDQVMSPFDYDMVQILHKEMIDHGCHVHLNDGLKAVKDGKVVLNSGKELPAEVVVMAIGVAPENQLAKDAGLELGLRGSIKVNHHYQTSDPNIYAVGDAIEVNSFFTGKPTRLPLAGPAQRQARAAADHINGRTYRNTGVIGSSVLKVFDYNCAATGMNEKQLQAEGIPYDFAYVIPLDHVGLMPNANPIFTKVLFAVPSGQLMGAQVIGKGNADKRADVMAAMIMMRGNLEDLKELELCYAPSYSTAKDPLNHAALVGLNILNGDMKHVHVSEIRDLAERGAFIIDSREEHEYEQGHIKGAHNIPLSQFRDRLDEIPKDQPVYVHCRSSQRSYNMCRALMQLGYDAINMDGSFLGLCMYEYFNDVTTDREPIVTEYNFN